MSSCNTEQLRALVKLISQNVEDYISRHEATGKGVPSIDSTEPGPLDDVQAIDEEYRESIKVTQGACAQLLAVMEVPGYAIVNVRCFAFRTIAPN